jgi:hypothetical protein
MELFCQTGPEGQTGGRSAVNDLQQLGRVYPQGDAHLMDKGSDKAQLVGFGHYWQVWSRP